MNHFSTGIPSLGQYLSLRNVFIGQVWRIGFQELQIGLRGPFRAMVFIQGSGGELVGHLR